MYAVCRWRRLITRPTLTEAALHRATRSLAPLNATLPIWLVMFQRPPAGRTLSRAWQRNGERQLKGWRKAQFAQSGGWALNPPSSARRTTPRAGLSNGESRLGSWGKTQLGQDVVQQERESWKLLLGGNGGTGEERSAASGYLEAHRPDGNRVATSSVRAAVIDSEPERVEPAAALTLFSSCAAGVGKRRSLMLAPTAW